MVHGARPKLRTLLVSQGNLRRITVVRDRFAVITVHQCLMHARNYGIRSMRSDCLDGYWIDWLATMSDQADLKTDIRDAEVRIFRRLAPTLPKEPCALTMELYPHPTFPIP